MQKNLSLPAVLQQLAAEGVEKVKLAIVDIDGVLRGKVMAFDKFASIASTGFGFCDVVFGWDAGDRAYDNGLVTGWHTGYPDAMAVVDPGTFRRVPWEGGIPFFLADFRVRLNGGAGSADAVSLGAGSAVAVSSSAGSADAVSLGAGSADAVSLGAGSAVAVSSGAAGADAALPVCPRGLLKQVIGRAAEAGYSAVFSQEFEWFNFIAPAAGEALSFSTLKPMTQGMFGYSILRASQGSTYFHALFDGLKQYGVPLEGLHTETGPGVYEAAILYADVLEAADRAVLFKAGVKEIACRHGILPTFMAKISPDLPGCSGHVHQSLWAADGSQNLFYDAASPTGISPLMESYIAGQLHCLPHILPMVAPTVNSYKRLVEGAWAPTTLTWGIDNRTVALRALPGSAKSTRLETRVVGSDSNPYLAMAACLAAGLYGVRHGLRLTTPATRGNGYADKSHGVLPRNLWEATQNMKHSPLAKELFGEAFVDHFVRTREWEWRQFGQAVTDWEWKRYFEII
jgi:glutamine synthetase